MTEPQPVGPDDAEAAYAALLRLWPRLREWLRPDQAVALWHQALPAEERQGPEERVFAQMRQRVRSLAAQRRRLIAPRVHRPLPGTLSAFAGEGEPTATTTPQSSTDGEVEVAHEA